MSHNIIFAGGIIICGIAAVGGIVAGLALRISKKRLNKQLDAEYGKRRHR